MSSGHASAWKHLQAGRNRLNLNKDFHNRCTCYSEVGSLYVGQSLRSEVGVFSLGHFIDFTAGQRCFL